jgi:hypothetical protein
MINVGMTIREMVALASNSSCTGDLYERIVRALEEATGNAMLLVACNGVSFPGQYWDHKISAIKSIRLATGWNLREAKEWVENCMGNHKTYYTCPMIPEKARQLNEELTKMGCSCWTNHA